MDHLTDEELANWYKEQMKKVTERTEERMREAKRTIPENKLNNELQKIREEGTKEIDRLSLEFQKMLLNPEHKTRCHINCYHCGEHQAQLKCADCDSQIFRFCSQQCGRDAYDEHSLLCYNRFNPQHLEDQLLEVIDEMQDPQEIDDAMDVLIDLEDQHPETMREAHEIIQAHLEHAGFERIEKLSDTERAARDAKRAAKREASAKRRQGILDKRKLTRERKGESAERKAQKRHNRKKRRADRQRKKAEDAAKKAGRYDQDAQDALARGQRQKGRAQKPGVVDKWHRWRKGHDEAAAEKYKGKAREGLQSQNP